MDTFRKRALKVALAFCALWLLIISGASLAVGGCAGSDPSRLNTLPSGCQRPSLPLKVAFEADTADLAPEVLYAGSTWSEVVGKTAFVLAAPGEAPDLMVVDGPSAQADWDAQVATIRNPDGRCYAVMTLTQPGGDAVTAYYLFLHELGHSLGLKDATDPQSVMFHWITPSITSGPGGADDQDDPFPAITPTDIATLRALYR